MKLLLDAHFSPKRLAAPLRKAGHDVLALSEASHLDGLTDEQVLALAAEEHRIVITRNARDFAPILRTWADTGRHHSGCILIWSLRHDEFGPILTGVKTALRARPRPADWDDLAVAI